MAGYDGAIEEATIHVGAVETFYRRRDGDGTPTVFVHGNPTNSEDWLPFMRGLRGPSLALDLPGWGRSARPDYDSFDGTMNGLAGFIEHFLEAVEVREHKLVCHDWGAVGLIAAQRHPESVRRLVALNTVPLSAGYRWHWVARRFWRRRGVGEAFNLGARTPLNKPVLRQVIRRMTPAGRAPQDLVDRVARHWDAGTSRAILRLYRSADPDALAFAGARLGELACPGLVIWAGADPFIPPRFGHELAAALPNASLIELPDAGHWPWVERPDIVPMTARFLEGG